eukprot:m.286913 g.286913  ORF g.286913 m.286913 type:complete len:375 (+) comp15784_c1_seq3:349-1473(+)
MSASEKVYHEDVVTLSFPDLLASADLSDHVLRAFGKDGLGLLAVVDLPESYQQARLAALAESWKFAHLDKETKDSFEVPPFFQRGWDHGHEMMKDGKPDFAKGSFYFNPVEDTFKNTEGPLKEKYPTFYGDNVFPTEQLPQFEPSVKACSKLMVAVGQMVARQCDALVERELKDSVEPKLNENIVRLSNHHAARLLHYFAMDETTLQDLDTDGWCGWHNDHCTLTSLVPAVFHNDETGEIIPNPDPTAGLYIRARDGRLVKPRAPAGALFFQIGETAQVHSGGVLMATPHMVKPVSVPGVSRSTLAVFLEPGHSYHMDLPPQVEPTPALTCAHLPEGVPTLPSRWSEGINFGDFSSVTFKAYYEKKTGATVSQS